MGTLLGPKYVHLPAGTLWDWTLRLLAGNGMYELGHLKQCFQVGRLNLQRKMRDRSMSGYLGSYASSLSTIRS